MPSLKCRDMGMNCGFEVKDENRDEMMQIISLHAEKTHGIKAPFSADMQRQLQQAIKE